MAQKEQALKILTLLFTMIWTATTPLLASQEPKADDKKKPASLSKEEREILKNREILENLELLLSLEKLSYFDLFHEPDEKKEETPAKPETKKDEKKQ